MHILEEVKSTLKHRQDELFKLGKKTEMLSTLSRTLLGSLETLLGSGDVAYSYGERKSMIAETDELIAGINASLMVEEREE